LVSISLPPAVLFDTFGNSNKASSASAVYQPFFPNVETTAVRYSSTLSVLYSLRFGASVKAVNPSTITNVFLSSGAVYAVSATVYSLSTSTFSGSTALPSPALLTALTNSAPLSQYSDRFIVNLTALPSIANTQALLLLSVPSGIFQDTAGNINSANGTFAQVSILTVGPVVRLFAGPSPTSAANIVFYVVFSSIVSDFLSRQALVSSAFSGPSGQLPSSCLQLPNSSMSVAAPNQYVISVSPASSACYSADSKPLEGIYSLYLPAGVSIDLAGNPSAQTAPVSILWLPYSPSVVVSSGIGSNRTFSANPSFLVTFSHAVALFPQYSDAVRLASSNVQSVVISQISPTDFTRFNISVVALKPGPVTLTIPAGVTYDAVGNFNLESNSFSLSFATCIDGLLNGDETSVDCGGSCPGPCPSCTDGLQNGLETGIDCGGPACNPCQCSTCPTSLLISTVQPTFVGQWALVSSTISSKPQYSRNSLRLYANQFFWYIDTDTDPSNGVVGYTASNAACPSQISTVWQVLSPTAPYTFVTDSSLSFQTRCPLFSNCSGCGVSIGSLSANQALAGNYLLHSQLYNGAALLSKQVGFGAPVYLYTLLSGEPTWVLDSDLSDANGVLATVAYQASCPLDIVDPWRILNITSGLYVTRTVPMTSYCVISCNDGNILITHH
jgi:hypothetical protein